MACKLVYDYRFPVRVVVDSREQQPYKFTKISADQKDGGGRTRIKSVVGTLDSGDYSLEGYENEIAIERKSLADFFGTLGQGRERFLKELQRLDEGYQFAAVVVESEWSEILQGYRHSRLSPKTIYRSVVAWGFRYPRVRWWFVAGRGMGEVTTFRLLERYYKEHLEC